MPRLMAAASGFLSKKARHFSMTMRRTSGFEMQGPGPAEVETIRRLPPCMGKYSGWVFPNSATGMKVWMLWWKA